MNQEPNNNYNPTKINQLLAGCPTGVPMTSVWLRNQGISSQLAKRYESGHWLESIGRGAWKRSGSELSLTGALVALQNQLGLQAYPAARTALEIQGRAHYLSLGGHPVLYLSLPFAQRLPAWFLNLPFARELQIINSTSLFDNNDDGLDDWQEQSASIKLSSPERAILEYCFLLPSKGDAEEAKQLMEGLTSLRPKLMQSLLKSCQSIKAKRLFLVLASLVNHPWYGRIEADELELGSGNRSLIQGGRMHPEFKITIPGEWLPE